MFNIGGGEMVVIFLLALLVLGPERLPKAMGQVGRAVAQMRKLSSGFQDEIRRAMDPIEAPFRPGEETLQGPVPSITDEVRVVNAEPDEPVDLGKDREDQPDEPVDLGKDRENQPVEPVAPDEADAAEPAPVDEADAEVPEPVALTEADDDIAVEPATQAVVVDDGTVRRGSVTPLRPRVVDADGDGDRATG